MSDIFIFHGTYGNPNENWFPWLKKELTAQGHQVFTPRFPTPENQNLELWWKQFKTFVPFLDNDTIFIGHSVGAAFLLNVLERINTPIKASYLVAGFLGSLNDPDFDQLNKTFVDKTFEWSKIKNNCSRFYVFSSGNDLYVPVEKAQELVSYLGAEGIMVQEAGHFNKQAGYVKFDLLLQKLKPNLAPTKMKITV